MELGTTVSSPSNVETVQSQKLVVRLRKEWTQELRAARLKQIKPCLWKALRRIIPGRSYAKLALLRLLIASTYVAFPVLVWLFLQNLAVPSSVNYNWALCHIAGISALLFVRALCVQRWILLSEHLNMRLKMATTGLIYNKVFSLTRHSIEKINSNKMIALVSNEVQKLDSLVMCAGMLLYTPLEIAGLLYIIWFVIGWQGVVGSGIFLVAIVYINALARPCSSLLEKKTTTTRKRIALIGDILQGIRTIKINAWETVVVERIKALRREEVAPLYLRDFIESTCAVLSFVSPSVAVLLTSFLLTLTGNQLESSAAFTFLVSLYVIKVSWLNNFDGSMRILADSKIALEKIQSILEHVTPFFSVENHKRQKEPGKQFIQSAQGKTSEEKSSLQSDQDSLEWSHSSSYKSAIGSQQSPEEITSLSETDSGNLRVSINELTCSWEEQSGRNTLENISLDASDGELVVITGPTNAGKSSLLMAILKEMPVVHGSVITTGSIAFIPQKPWIISGSLRDNIILDRPFREQKYRTILRACALRKEFLMFPSEDMTDVGNNGSALNDSMRARLSLARALYSDADIYLMDDFLSKIDETTGEHIYRVCICGLLANRVRFLVTTQTQYLSAADHVLAMRRGSVLYQGKYSDAASTGDFFNDVFMLDEDKASPTSDKNTEMKALKGGQDDLTLLFQFEEKELEVDVSVTWSRLFWRYILAGQSLCAICLLLLLFLLAQACIIAPSWWLQRMVNMSRDKQAEPLTIKIHGSLVSAALAVTTVVAFCCYYTSLKSSQRLHERMSAAILKAPLKFFDTSHPEQIKAEFLKNFHYMDQELPRHILGTVQTCLFAVSSLIVPVVLNHWVLLAFVPMCVCLVYYGRFHFKFFSETKQNEAVKRSALCSHFRETVTGLEVIRSSNTEKQFIQQFYSYLDKYTPVLRLLSYNKMWLQLRLDLLWALYITAVASGAVLTGSSSSLTGLSLTFAMESLAAMQNALSHTSEVQSLMRSVERAMAYAKLAEEPGYANGTKPPKSWPSKGTLEVRNMTFAKSIGGSKLLSNVSFAVTGGEKARVVGREGSGVSFLSAALFRMPEPKGRVFIDGIDIGKLNLQVARKSMMLTSKDVVSFPGNVRDILDPVKEFPDDAMWTALDKVQLKTAVEALPGKLDCDLRDPGAELTGTQRQLICLARALLSKTRILIVEEDSSGAGLKMNSVIRDVITKCFKACTVLTVSHRFDPNCDCDRLFMVKQGHIINHRKSESLEDEQGGPDLNVLPKPNS